MPCGLFLYMWVSGFILFDDALTEKFSDYWILLVGFVLSSLSLWTKIITKLKSHGKQGVTEPV